MFGRMMVQPVLEVGTDADFQVAAAALVRMAETAEIVRRIEFPASVLLFLLVPGDPEFGAVYVFRSQEDDLVLSRFP